VPTRGDREPTSFDITACMHEANLPLGENSVRRTVV
jgi:hypothetical protein